MTGFRRVLVLGGARSGKSRYAQALAETTSFQKIFIATAQAQDDEMRARIARHRHDRGSDWVTREEPMALAHALAAGTGPDRVALVDCLTLWLSNTMLAGEDVERATGELVAAIVACRGPVILVSNEVGSGIVPATALGRAFRDAQGRLNQAVAAACEAVVLVAAGCPLLIKPAPAFELPLR